MTNSAKRSISVVLNDVDSQRSTTLPLRVIGNESAISVFAEGYGDFGSSEGFGCPVFLELNGGTLRVVIFADINRQDPTHFIDLSRAREDFRLTSPLDPASASPVKQGRIYYQMLSQINPKTGRCYTMKEAAEAVGVNYATFRNRAALWRSPSDTDVKGSLEHKMKIVRATVEGGVVQHVEVPKGVVVIVKDYDVEGTPKDVLEKDENGDSFIEAIWEHE